MLNIREYVKVQSLEEAYELNQKRTNKVIGGMLWMKMGSRNIQKAIDLSGLGLDKIEETEEEFRIGCMTTLRDLELHPGLEAYTGGAMKKPPPISWAYSSGIWPRWEEAFSGALGFQMC